MEYFSILLYILFCIYKFDYKRQRNSNCHFMLLLLVFVLISGLAYRVGTDAVRYEYGFYTKYKAALNFSKLFSESVGGFEPFWTLFNWLIFHIFGDWLVFKIIFAAFINGTIFWTIKRHCRYPFLAILFYFLFIYFEYNFESLRETLSICFMLIAMDVFSGKNGNEKNYVQYFLLAWPAIFFHSFGFIVLLFPAFVYFRYNVNLIILFTIALSSVSIIMESIYSLSMINFISGDSADSMIYYVESDSYGLQNLNMNGMIAVLVLKIVAPLILLKNTKRDNYQSLAITFVVVYTIASFMLIFYRINNYLLIPMIITLGNSLGNSLFKKDFSEIKINILQKKFVIISCLLLMLSLRYSSLFTTDLWDHFYPYSSIFTKETFYSREMLF